MGLSPTTGANVVANPNATTTYTVTGTDTHGCSSDTSVTVIVAPLTVTATETDENCGQANGTATAIPSETCTQGWSYLWNTTPTQQTTITAINLPQGIYDVTISCGVCTASTSITVNNLVGPSVAITSSTNTTCGYANGGAIASASGNNPPFTYTWTGGQGGAILSNVIAGTYNVSVQDAVGCTATNSITITDTPAPTAVTTSDNSICDKPDGTATVHANGGLGTYTYLWSNGITTPTDTGLIVGTYSVTVSDGECSTSATVNVGNTPGPTAGFSENPMVLTLLDGPVTFLDNSMGAVVNWQWSFGDGAFDDSSSTAQHQYNNLGIYLVTLIVTDKNGCKDTAIDTVKIIDYYTFYIPNAFTPNGDSLNDFFTPRGMNVDPNNYQEYIFDRWGNLTFQTTKWDTINHQAEGWNGRYNNSPPPPNGNVVMDIYVYRILAKEFNGGPLHEYIGRITLVH
jgi:gliding motility-associated-like protein